MEAALIGFTGYANHFEIPVCRRDAYQITYQLLDGYTLVHAAFQQPLTTTILRRFRRDIDVLFELHGGALHAASERPHGDDYRKFTRFVTGCGFEFHCWVVSPDGRSIPWFTRWK